MKSTDFITVCLGDTNNNPLLGTIEAVVCLSVIE